MTGKIRATPGGADTASSIGTCRFAEARSKATLNESGLLALRGYRKSRCVLLNNRDSLALEWVLIRRLCCDPTALSGRPLTGRYGSASG